MANMQSRKGDESKVPEVGLTFWVIKIAATTLGETAGDTVSMTMNLGYLVGTLIFAALLILLIWFQIAARRFHPMLYWATIIASTTAGTTMADFADRSLGIGYTGGSTLLLTCVIGSLGLWHWSTGSVSIASVRTPKAEIFYWLTITFSQTLGTALGDWIADGSGLGLGYEGGAIIFSIGLLVLLALYMWTRISHVLLFWIAFILTRPLGATVGDLLDKPIAQGGMDFSRPLASLVLGIFIIGCVILLPQRAGGNPEAQRFPRP